VQANKILQTWLYTVSFNDIQGKYPKKYSSEFQTAGLQRQGRSTSE
jgi:hypothetical protein